MRVDELVGTDDFTGAETGPVAAAFVIVVVVVAFDDLGGSGGGGECFLATLRTVESLGPDRLVDLELERERLSSSFSAVAPEVDGTPSVTVAAKGGFRVDVVERDGACLAVFDDGACLAGFDSLLGASVPTVGLVGPFFGVLVP